MFVDFLYELRNTVGARPDRAVERAFKLEPEEFDLEFRRWLRKKYGRVSAERVLSGAGLSNLYSALSEISGQHVPELSAAEVTSSLCFVTERVMPTVSHSWNASVPIAAVGTWPVMTTIGIESM